MKTLRADNKNNTQAALVMHSIVTDVTDAIVDSGSQRRVPQVTVNSRSVLRVGRKILNPVLTENTEDAEWKNREKLLKLFARRDASELVRG